jgi:hypothetical protein
LDVDGAEVVGELVDVSGADDRVDDGRLGSCPCDRHLRRGYADFVGDGADRCRNVPVALGRKVYTAPRPDPYYGLRDSEIRVLAEAT